MTTPSHAGRPGAPSAREIADLMARLRELTAPGREADPGERARFLADKQALLARIADTEPPAGDATASRADAATTRTSPDAAVSEGRTTIMTEPSDDRYEQHDFERLADAIATVVQDMRDGHGEPDMTAEDAIARLRADNIDSDEVGFWVEQQVVSPQVAAAYRHVIGTSDEAFTPAVTSHAEGVLDGTFTAPECPTQADSEASHGDEHGCDEQGRDEQGDDDSEGDPAETEVLGTDDVARRDARRELDTRREPFEFVEVAESDNAALACATATAAVAEAAARARAVGDEDVVGVVIVEDLEAACDEDGGF